MKNIEHDIFERGVRVVGLSFKKTPKFDGETFTAKWVFLIRFVVFTSNHVYSAV